MARLDEISGVGRASVPRQEGVLEVGLEGFSRLDWKRFLLLEDLWILFWMEFSRLMWRSFLKLGRAS